MVAALGTIPALQSYQPGALTITGQELVEIASSNNATSAVSAAMLITDLVGKAPSAIVNGAPNSGDRLAFFQSSSGLPKSCSFGSLGIAGLGVVLATTATTGYLALPTCVGTPTGIPLVGSGAQIFDTANSFIWVYNGGWKHVAVA